MIVVIDIDEVLGDTITSILDFFNKNYNGSLTHNDLGRYPYLGFLGETKEEAAEKCNRYSLEYGPHAVKPFPEAIKAVKKLSEIHELKVLTSRPYYTKKETEEWLELHFPGMFTEVLFNNKHTPETYVPGEQKQEILKKINADVFIEDNLKYVIDCPHVKVFLIDKPWNQGEIPNNVTRVTAWTEITEELT